MMKTWLFERINKLVGLCFTGFILLTFYFTLVSPNFTLGTTKTKQTFGQETTILLIAILLFIFGSCLLYFNWGKFQHICYFLFKQHALFTATLIFVGVIVWQLLFISAVHPAIGFDVQALHQALDDPSSPQLRGYFSLNSNNLFLLLIMHDLSDLFQTNSWYFWALVSLILTDLSALLNLFTIGLLDKTKIALGSYLQSLWLLLFPMVIVPYSDTFVLPCVSLLLLCYVAAFHSSFSTVSRLLWAFLGGGSVSLIYFIKPSAIIPAISLVIIELCFLLKKKQGTKLISLCCLGLFLVGSWISYTYIAFDLKQQTYIKIQPERRIPAWHFISIGMTGDGGYDPKAALTMAKLPTKAEKVAYSKQNIKHQLHEKGFWGYLKFLFFKHQRNTSDGTFAWQLEGNFFASPQPTKTRLQRFFSSFVTKDGTHAADFRYLAQLNWLLLLSLIVWGNTTTPLKAWRQMLKLTLVGGFVYLLLFEGGRSRYLIQFLPVFLVLATLSFSQAKIRFKRTFSWLK